MKFFYTTISSFKVKSSTIKLHKKPSLKRFLHTNSEDFSGREIRRLSHRKWSECHRRCLAATGNLELEKKRYDLPSERDYFRGKDKSNRGADRTRARNYRVAVFISCGSLCNKKFHLFTQAKQAAFMYYLQYWERNVFFSFELLKVKLSTLSAKNSFFF